MKLDTNSNLYTFIYASVLVIVVAAALAFTAVKLKPMQDKNIRVEKMQNILQSIGINANFEEAEKLYNLHITNSYAVNSKGEKLKNVNAFDINLKIQYKEKLENRILPVYEAKTDDDSVKIIIPLRGKGLWGPIWGYFALNDDYNTIYGAVFNHKGETPGLGAEIATPEFQKQFNGKTLFEGNQFVSITVYKGGKGSALKAGDTKHGVDAVSGGTITSKGLEGMVKDDWLFAYKNFLAKNKK
ncbi:MAG: NADH:ubiquinone reductase (Na(+)-transporting) subunit C [Bacteroidetes bacterium 4484_249]|nr:MAG: NADH:ubiquinone reductase (Na(+)-transporting) subunit C [Bacteroidetes bacterium 4484_249]